MIMKLILEISLNTYKIENEVLTTKPLVSGAWYCENGMWPWSLALVHWHWQPLMQPTTKWQLVPLMAHASI